MNNDSSIDNNDLSDEWIDEDYCEKMEGFTDEMEAGKKN